MQIKVNGKNLEVAEHVTVQGLIQFLDLGNGRVAVELNREILPRSEHDTQVLRQNDIVEIVQAIGGG
ncbi:MAG: sulfur carrier protein ThiS [Pseudohongiellaceae bacterium]